MLNIEELLQPVRADAPAGANLEYSPEFAELERTAAGKPERQIGASVVPAEEPDWRALVAQSEALLKSTKDLRVANHLVRGLLRTDGFAGLAGGLQLLRGLVDRYWAELHPQLDAEDDHDPTFRVNAMAALTHRDLLQAIRAAPLLRARGFGAVTLREIDAATTSPGQPASTQAATVEAVFHQVPLTELAEASRDLERCWDEASGLAQAWGARHEGEGPDFTELRRVIGQANQVLKTRLAVRQPPESLEASIDANADGSRHSSQDGASNSSIRSGADGAAIRGDLRSREDVVRALDGICAYYARHEPSSPVPLLLERCKRLATMSFLDIVKDMLPEGVSTVQTIAGKAKD